MNANTLIWHKKWGLLIAITIICLLIVVSFYSTLSLSAPDTHSQAELRQLQNTLLKKQGSIHTQWLKTLNPLVKKTEGDLVWYNPNQQGVMKFINLPATKKQQIYHLWVYDLKRNQDDPIEGGYFSVTKNKVKELFIPIELSEAVIQPYKFMIILESKDNHKKKQTLLLAQP